MTPPATYICPDYSAAILTEETARLAEIDEADLLPKEFDGKHYIVLFSDDVFVIAPSKEELEDKLVIIGDPDDHGFFKIALRALPRVSFDTSDKTPDSSLNVTWLFGPEG